MVKKARKDVLKLGKTIEGQQHVITNISIDGKEDLIDPDYKDGNVELKMNSDFRKENKINIIGDNLDLLEIKHGSNNTEEKSTLEPSSDKRKENEIEIVVNDDGDILAELTHGSNRTEEKSKLKILSDKNKLNDVNITSNNTDLLTVEKELKTEDNKKVLDFSLDPKRDIEKLDDIKIGELNAKTSELLEIGIYKEQIENNVNNEKKLILDIKLNPDKEKINKITVDNGESKVKTEVIEKLERNEVTGLFEKNVELKNDFSNLENSSNDIIVEKLYMTNSKGEEIEIGTFYIDLNENSLSTITLILKTINGQFNLKAGAYIKNVNKIDLTKYTSNFEINGSISMSISTVLDSEDKYKDPLPDFNNVITTMLSLDPISFSLSTIPLIDKKGVETQELNIIQIGSVSPCIFKF